LQRVVCGSLETLPLLAFKAGLTPPTLIIVGKVVKLHDRLAWFTPHGMVATNDDQPAILTAGSARCGARQRAVNTQR